MGKTARWFLGLLGWTKGESPSPSAAAVSDAKPVKEKKRWSFVKSLRDKDRTPAPPVNGDEKNGSYREGSSSHADGVDQNKHAIAVAAATAAVAQAAVAAAQAAAAVVRITSSERCDKSYVSGNVGRREDWAALKIQAMFRGYLARRALRALKGLVKLQALVRGHIVRKEMQAKLLGLQALVRVQSKARAGRTHNSESQLPIGKQSLLPHHLGLATPDKYEQPFRTNSAKHDWLSNLKRKGLKPNSWDAINLDKTHSGSNWFEAPTMRNGITDDEKSDKILEIDNGKPNFNSKRRQALASDRKSHSCTTFDSPSRDYTTAQLSVSSPSSCEVQSLGPLKFSQQVVDTAFGIADDSSQFFSASSRPGSAKRGSFTPLESEEGSQSFLGGYFDHPNYMANTKSSMAKARSQSTPKQRPDYERSSSVKRFPVHGFGDMRSSARRTAALHANFVRKAYPGSGRLDRLGMPIHSDTCDRNRY